MHCSTSSTAKFREMNIKAEPVSIFIPTVGQINK